MFRGPRECVLLSGIWWRSFSFQGQTEILVFVALLHIHISLTSWVATTDIFIYGKYIFYYLVCGMAYTCIKYLKETFFLKNKEKISWIDFRSTVIKGPFRIGARALYNTLWSKCFTGSFARALAFAEQCLSFLHAFQWSHQVSSK